MTRSRARSRVLALVAALVLTAVVSACSSGSKSSSGGAPTAAASTGSSLPPPPLADPECPPANLQEIDPASLAVTASAQGGLQQGKGTTWQIAIKNNSQQPVSMVFTSSQDADIELSQGGAVKYRWADGRVFTQVLHCRLVAPGDTLTLSEAEDRPITLAPGQYDLLVRLVSGPLPPDFTTLVTVAA